VILELQKYTIFDQPNNLSSSASSSNKEKVKKRDRIDALSWPFLKEYYITSSPHGVSFSMEI
jgi:hypothetical protein